MSVYSERFLQTNVVDYKLILMRNHKKKVLLLSPLTFVAVAREI